MSTLGLDGVLPWTQAHYVAGAVAGRLPSALARLDEADGALLAADLVTVQDDPAQDSARWDGVAVCGEGPWRVHDAAVLSPGTGRLIARDEAVPGHCDAVIHRDLVHIDEGSDHPRAIGLDPLTRLPEERVRPELGEGIVVRAERSAAGSVLLAGGRPVTPAAIALAAATGYDDLEVIRPPVVGTLVLGARLLDRGEPRQGRVRDALGPAIPAFVGALGARGNPAVRAPDTAELLLREIDDAQVDVLITTGSTAPGPDNHLRNVLADLSARWLVDGVAVTPGAQMVLARLPDGRFLVGLPGDPVAAFAGLVTLVAPLIAALRGAAEVVRTRSAVLVDDVAPAEFADDTVLVPVRLETSTAGRLARPGPPLLLAAWAQADAIAVVPPGAGFRGDVVELLGIPRVIDSLLN